MPNLALVAPSQMTAGDCARCGFHHVRPDGEHCLCCLWNLLRTRALETDHPDDWTALDELNQLIEETR
jgi:hypothetical protein